MDLGQDSWLEREELQINVNGFGVSTVLEVVAQYGGREEARWVFGFRP
jgi:hypothetical protein